MLGEKNTDSTYSFNWKVAIWVKQGRITQFNHRDTPQTCLKYFLQEKIQPQQESLTPSFHKLDEDIKKDDSGAEEPSQSKSVLTLPRIIWGAVQMCTLSAPQCQIMLNMLPFLIFFFLFFFSSLKNSQLGNFEEHKMQQEEHQRHHSARPWDSQDEQGAELLSALRGQRGICLFGNPNFTKVLETHAATENFWTWKKQKWRERSPHSRAPWTRTKSAFLIFYLNLSEFSLFQKLSCSNKTKL